MAVLVSSVVRAIARAIIKFISSILCLALLNVQYVACTAVCCLHLEPVIDVDGGRFQKKSLLGGRAFFSLLNFVPTINRP